MDHKTYKATIKTKPRMRDYEWNPPGMVKKRLPWSFEISIFKEY